MIDVHYVLVYPGGNLPRFHATTIREDFFVWARLLNFEPRNTSVQWVRELICCRGGGWINLIRESVGAGPEYLGNEQIIAKQ